MHEALRSMSGVLVEVYVDYGDIVAHKPEGEWLTTAPLRCLSIDIECQGRKGVFPELQHDSIIQIANYVWELRQRRPMLAGRLAVRLATWGLDPTAVARMILEVRRGVVRLCEHSHVPVWTDRLHRVLKEGRDGLLDAQDRSRGDT